MTKNLSWKSGRRYCAGKNKNGDLCGNLVPKGVRYCHVHRRKVGEAKVTRDRTGANRHA